ncbi:MAG: 4-hydroxybenzoate synthetase [Paenibacillus sp.]|jgi:hypothetical protein|nr:4-hydroxybenzoate synthetase [Paenibacillus sp.]
MDAHDGRTEFEFLQKLLFDLLLRSDGRTTDMLETLMDDKLSVRVIAQEQVEEEQLAQSDEMAGAPYYRRESILVSEKSNFVVSHNVALVCSKYVPAPMFEALAARQEGIGKTISALGLHTSRRLADYGWRNETEAVDLFQRPLKLHFAETNEMAPYKKYFLYFDSVPGINMIEYFNPNMIRHRLKQVIAEKQQRNGQ